MIGSEKQIEWASEIRAEAIRAIDEYLLPKIENAPNPAQKIVIENAISEFLGNEEARYWIDLQMEGKFTRIQDLLARNLKDARGEKYGEKMLIAIQGGEVRGILAQIIKSKKN